jgi:hypothetical protein
MYQLRSCVVAGVQPNEKFTDRDSPEKGLAATVWALTYRERLHCVAQPRDIMFGVDAQSLEALSEGLEQSRGWSIIVQAYPIPRPQDVVRPRE